MVTTAPRPLGGGGAVFDKVLVSHGVFQPIFAFLLTVT